MASSENGGPRRHQVVVVGGGFGGLAAVRALKRAPVDVTLIDRRNFHLFQPLLYQVATSGLSPGEIASPLRGVLKRQRNARVILAEVAGFDLERQRVLLGRQANAADGGEVPYDSLVVAAGASHSYFGRDDWEPKAPGLKTLEDALTIRRRILRAFEAAEIEPDPERRRAWLTFVVVGAGPTGVELAGQIAEIARHTLKRDFRNINPGDAEIVLLEAADRVLPPYEEGLSVKAHRSLERLGVTPRVGTLVTEIDLNEVTLEHDGQVERIPANTVVWAAGVQASPLAAELARASGSEIDRAGRITVDPDLTIRGYPEVYAIGDMVRVSDGAGGVLPLPGVAQPAMQEGRYAAQAIKSVLEGGARPTRPFSYRDKGNLATIGRSAAVADIRGLRFGGAAAWLVWLFVHLLFLMGLQNRFVVFVRWILSFLTYGRSARLITGEGSETSPRTPDEVVRMRALAAHEDPGEALPDPTTTR